MDGTKQYPRYPRWYKNLSEQEIQEVLSLVEWGYNLGLRSVKYLDGYQVREIAVPKRKKMDCAEEIEYINNDKGNKNRKR